EGAAVRTPLARTPRSWLGRAVLLRVRPRRRGWLAPQNDPPAGCRGPPPLARCVPSGQLARGRSRLSPGGLSIGLTGRCLAVDNEGPAIRQRLCNGCRGETLGFGLCQSRRGEALGLRLFGGRRPSFAFHPA